MPPAKLKNAKYRQLTVVSTSAAADWSTSTAADWSTVVINSQLAKVHSLQVVTTSGPLSFLGSLCKLKIHAMSEVATELRIEDTTNVVDADS